MILFHASYMEIVKPDIMHSRTEVDFGRGFYTTPLIGQAENKYLTFEGGKTP